MKKKLPRAKTPLPEFGSEKDAAGYFEGFKRGVGAALNWPTGS
ncbi:MAG: hypothetical protein ABSH09_15205 [Bryobacteraceae bacterium]|jgi:hypothetical protein